MRGRKPKGNAIRRGGAQPVDAQPVERFPSVSIPDHIARNPAMREAWELLFPDTTGYAPTDIPLMESQVLSYLIMRQAESQIVAPDGRVALTYMQRTADGQPVPESIRPNPAIKIARDATATLLRVGDALQSTPQARQRAGLVDAMTKSTQADVVRKTMDGYDEFRRRIADAQD